jgi:hypothetical protein
MVVRIRSTVGAHHESGTNPIGRAVTERVS